ncbi:hypothetical protein [Conexibacter woesei]|uniref:hypothetical protein n=1 Tax=Conexibacter woesei TaxID=191495 RepID=UPI00042A9303|nr:hypothetical protein [Conexibacter woesei]
MPRFERDPQSELVRRYQRILRSAPAEATRVATPPRATTVTTAAGAPAGPLRRTPAPGAERAPSNT